VFLAGLRTVFRIESVPRRKAPSTREENAMHWYLCVLRNYAQFNGRSRRSEYWYFALFNLLILVGLTLVDLMVYFMTGSGLGILRLIYGLAIFVPAIAVSIRRLHDTDHSGWWLLLAFVPVAGLVLLWFMAQDSDAGTNRYGQNPKLVIA
jgi:uncharacterized membrane protein YhaH (DUF805 family)